MQYFFYGTMKDAEVFAVVAGRPLSADGCDAATLAGYRLARVRDECYPCLAPSAGGETDGLVVSDLSQGEIDRINFFEGNDYCPETVAVTLTASRQAVAATTFLNSSSVDAEETAWRYAEWRVSAEKERFLRLAHAWMAIHGRYPPDDPALDDIWRAMLAADARAQSK